MKLRHASERLKPLARSFIYQFLARCYETPNEETFKWLQSPETASVLRSAIVDFSQKKATDLLVSGDMLLEETQLSNLDLFSTQYHLAFGHAARGRCPLNEIEYGELGADPLFQPHRLADLAGFYKAFGLEVSDTACERHDHLSMQCEFMSVVCAKEEYHQKQNPIDQEMVKLCITTEKNFIKEHLARWVPAFTHKLSQEIPDGLLFAISEFTRTFIEKECQGLGIPVGSQDLLLRVIDEEEESMCGSCGINNLPPGALKGSGGPPL